VTRSDVQGRVYVERGHTVEIITRQGPADGCGKVLIYRETGELAGLRQSRLTLQSHFVIWPGLWRRRLMLPQARWLIHTDT
jgi:hypothetical protein